MPSFAELDLTAATIHDSRGRETVQVVARLDGLEGTGDVPSGASKGRDEARTVPVEAACQHVTKVLLEVVRQVPGDAFAAKTVLAADAALAEAAGPNFARLGANATLPISRALWRLAAAGQQVPLWRLWRAAYGRPPKHAVPACYFNVFNGGLHALRSGEQLGIDRIDIQEIMVVPRSMAPEAALACGDAIDEALSARLVANYGAERVGRGDEAGLSVRGVGDTEVAIAHVLGAIAEAGYRPGEDVALALDVAAGSMYGTNSYRLAGRELDGEALAGWLIELAGRRPGLFVSIEDGLEEDDWAGWSALTAALRPLGVLTVGDDLFVTQPVRLARGIAARAAHAVLVKVNQNGTVGGTLAVMREAYDADLDCIVSHRSGETLDDSIADLALATGALGLKAGAPQPPRLLPDERSWVRRKKYLRLIDAAAEAANFSGA